MVKRNLLIGAKLEKEAYQESVQETIKFKYKVAESQEN